MTGAQEILTWKREKMFSKIKILVPFILLFSGGVGPAGAITGEEIVTKVVNKIKKARDLSVSFEKSFYWKLAGETQRLKGQFYLKKPRKLRLETEEQTIVTDGDTVWTFVPENKQVIVSSWEQWQDPLTQLLKYTESYQPTYGGMEKVQKSKCYLVQLLPEQEGEEIVQIKLWVDRRKWLPRKLEYLDLNGNVTSYLLSIKVNSDFKDSLFEFIPPKGVETVDIFKPSPDTSEKR